MQRGSEATRTWHGDDASNCASASVTCTFSAADDDDEDADDDEDDDEDIKESQSVGR